MHQFIEILEKYWQSAIAITALVILWSSRITAVVSWCRGTCGRVKKWLFTGLKHHLSIGSIDTLAVDLDNLKHQILIDSTLNLKEKIDLVHNLAYMAALRSQDCLYYVDIPMYECDKNTGHCVWVNKALANLFGMNEEDMLGTGWLNAVEQSQIDHVWERWQLAIEKNIPYVCNYTVINQQTKQPIDCCARAVKIRNSTTHEVLMIRGTVEKIRKN